MQRVAQALSNVDGEIEVSMDFDEKGPGMYQPENNNITLSPRIFTDQEAVVSVLNHELVHAATVRGLAIDPKLEEDIGRVMQRVRKWARSAEGRKFLAAVSYTHLRAHETN